MLESFQYFGIDGYSFGVYWIRLKVSVKSVIREEVDGVRPISILLEFIQ